MTQAVNLHEIINHPGFGWAKKVLKRQGLWDEYGGLEAREYRVWVEYSVMHEGKETVTVIARCDEEAEELACKKIEDDHDYDVEFSSVEVKK